MNPSISNVQAIRRYEGPQYLIQPERSPSDWETISQEAEGCIILEQPVIGYGVYNAVIRVTYSNGHEYDYLATANAREEETMSIYGTYTGYVPQYYMPPVDVDGWMDGDWDGYDRETRQDAANARLFTILERDYPDISFVLDARGTQPTYQGITYRGGNVASDIDALTGASSDSFDDAYQEVFEHADQWLAPEGT